MVLQKHSALSGGLRGPPQLVLGVVVLAVVLGLALPVRGDGRCSSAFIDCRRNCDPTSDVYMPQRCDECCSNARDGGDDGDGGKGENAELEVMETAVQELRVMVGVLLALVLLLLVAVVALLLRHTSHKSFLKFPIPVSFSNKEDGASIQKRPPPQNKVPCENRNSTVGRIADHQNNHSPLVKRMHTPNGQAVTEASAVGHALVPPPHHPRARHPSESTCPDESADLPHPHQHAYDNLALSTSTLHDTTTSSTSTLAPAVSTNTLETTLPSVNATAVLRDPDSTAIRI